jgi:hypothetical protein
MAAMPETGRERHEHDNQTGRVLWRCDCPRVASYEGHDRKDGNETEQDDGSEPGFA